MPTTCGFPNCKFRSRYKGFEDNRHFYRVPKKPAVLRDKWLEAIGRTEANIVSQLRICSGHFHGGEKKEGDIPVADPATDPPRRIELPSKGLRIPTASVESAALGRGYGTLVRSTVTISTSHRRGGGPSTHCRFRPLSMATRDKAGVSVKPPALPPLPPPPLLPSQTLSAMASTLIASPAALGGMDPITMVIFDRFSDYFLEFQTLKNCIPPMNNVAIVRELNEIWLTPEVFRTAAVIIFYDMDLYDKEIIRHFINLQMVILADVCSGSIDEASNYFRSRGGAFQLSRCLVIIFMDGNPLVVDLQHYGLETMHLYFNVDPIGLAVARRCSIFGLQVIVHDPTVSEGICSGLGLAQSEHLESLLPLCNFVSFHNWKFDPSNDRGYQLNITSQHLSLMRKDLEPKCFHVDGVAFSIDTLLTSSSDSKPRAPFA
ncbi:unnamed protein product [Taenia asiatica]|uniref:THAP-type domain-containing protein n=1 Tax=Taenia asiatica TaxID=60517 RepID=A0A0R3W870_TAEAS|nr:unnamed protein product [Taenia asiatica]